MQRVKRMSLLCALSALLSMHVQEYAAQGAQRIEAIRQIQDGDNNLQMGLYNEAIFSYTNAITTDPSYAEAYVKRANLLQRIGRYTEAKQDMEKARNMNPYSAYVMDGSAKVNFLAEDYARGLEEVNQAILLDPENQTFIDHHLDGCILSGEYELAKRDLEKLLESAYNLELTYLKQALVYFLDDELETAETAIESVLAINPENPLAYDVRGLIRLKEHRYEEALQEFDMALKIFPEFSLALYNKGVAFKLMNDDQQALGYFDKAITQQLDISKAYFQRGIVKRDLGNYAGSISDYSEVKELDSIYFNAIYNRAFSYKMLGDFPSALTDATEAIELKPTDAKAWGMRGNVHLLFGDFDQAIKDYDQALKWDNQLIEIRFNQGLALLFDHRVKEGCATLERAVADGYVRGDEAYRNFCTP